MHFFKLNEDIHRQIAEEYLKDERNTSTILAKKYNVSFVLICNILKKFNITTKPRQGRFSVDLDYFKKIDRSSKAYFLGLFHADGCNAENMGTFRINLQERDVKILEVLKKDLQYTGKLRYIKRQAPRVNQYSLNITSISMSKDLVKLGYMANKTFKVKFPDIKEEYYSHFIRGMFDGDGHLSTTNKTKFEIVGTYDSLEKINSILVNFAKIKSASIKETSSKGVFRFSVSSKIDVFKILCYIYKNKEEFYIDRKYETFVKKFLDQEIHLYWQVYCENLETGEKIIFENMQTAKKYFNLKTYGAIAYCINKSKNKIFRKKFYLNLLQNENTKLRA